MKKVLAIILSVVMIIGVMPITTFALPVMVQSISAVMTKDLIEGTDCGMMGIEWEDEDGNIITEECDFYPWYEYAEYTVEYNFGKTYTGDYWDVQEKFDYEILCYDDQDMENEWGVGTYLCTVELYDKSCDVEVNVVESPIESVSAVMKRDLIENVDGYYDYDYIDGSDETTDEYFRYYWRNCVEYTVTYKDGETFTGYEYELYYEFDYWPMLSDDQSFENQWGIGTHNANIRFLGKECELEIQVVECPIESVSAVMTKDLIENADGYFDCDYIDETDELTDDYFRYDWEYDVEYTLTYKDGETFTGDEYDLNDMFGQWPELSDDQSYENQWDIGAHKGTVNFMGIECEIDINVIETPVKSVSAVAEIYEGVDGWVNEEDSFRKYFEYFWSEYAIYTIEFKDGSTFTGDAGTVYEEYGYWPYWTNDDQSYKNQWGLGTHSGEFEFMGAIGTAEINIVKNPFEGISATMTRDLLETVDGDSYEEENGDIVYYYDWYPYLQLTVTYDGGKEFTGSVEEVEEKFGRYVYVYDGQYDTEIWGVGKHIGFVEFVNMECQVEINVVESDGMMLGDINGDGNITAVDARQALQCVAGLAEFTDAQSATADVNRDGQITAVDARLILQFVAGLTEF